jgi:hypothetical protein
VRRPFYKMSLRGVLKGRRRNPRGLVRTPRDCFVAALRLLAMTFFLSLTVSSYAQHLRLFACAIANDSAGAFLGGSSNGSGLYQSDDTGKTWKHLGWDNIKCYSMDEVQSSNGRILYEATGLGILLSTDYGAHWKQLTDWRISEAMDIEIDPKNSNNIWIATAHGSWQTKDEGKTWTQIERTSDYWSRVSSQLFAIAGGKNIELNASLDSGVVRNGIITLPHRQIWTLKSFVVTP